MNLFPYIAIGGAVGSCLRFALAGWITRWAGTGFPWGILSINVLGSLLMGLLVGWLARSGAESRTALHALLAVGFLGGFTTFSSFALDVVTLVQRGQGGMAVGYALASVSLAVLALGAGMAMMRAV